MGAKAQLVGSGAEVKRGLAAGAGSGVRIAIAGLRFKGATLLAVLEHQPPTAGSGDAIVADRLAVTTVDEALKAALTTALAGADNDLVYTANVPGARGNDITVEYVVAGNNTPLSLVVGVTTVSPDQMETNITVNLATDGGGTATSTANDVRDLLSKSELVRRLVNVVNAGGNDGTGTLIVLSKTNLSGGSDDAGIKIAAGTTGNQVEVVYRQAA